MKARRRSMLARRRRPQKAHPRRRRIHYLGYMVYNRVLTPLEISMIERHLSRQYGIPLERAEFSVTVHENGAIYYDEINHSDPVDYNQKIKDHLDAKKIGATA